MNLYIFGVKNLYLIYVLLKKFNIFGVIFTIFYTFMHNFIKINTKIDLKIVTKSNN